MTVVKHVVHTQLTSIQLRLVETSGRCSLVYKTLGVRILHHRIVLSVTVIVIFQHAEQIETVLSIVEVKFLQAVYIVSHSQHCTTVESIICLFILLSVSYYLFFVRICTQSNR